tara:strand:+ start:3680 stop:3910 length:231 start_codon:yes stop_codon:yes gene_type:complete
MKDTEIEKLRQIVSRNDISGNEKVEMLIIFTENYHSIQLMQTAVGQSEQLVCSCGSIKVHTTGGSQCPNNRCSSAN